MATKMPRERARTRARKWGRRLAKALGALIVLAVVSVLVVLHSLDQPWVKRRVQAIVAKEVGVEIDYGSVRVALASGSIDVDDLVVRSPPEMRAAVPELARVKHATARWSPRALVTKKDIERLVLTDVAVTIAVDENGRTSLDPIFTRHVPLSRKIASVLGSPLPFREARVEKLAVTLASTEHGAVVERTVLRGIDADVEGEPARRGAAARVRLGSSSAPISLELERHGSQAVEGAAHARASGLAVADSSHLALTLDLNVDGEALVPSVGKRAVHLAGRARFGDAKTDVAFDAQAAEGSGRGFATIPDDGDLVVHLANGDVDGAGLIHAKRADLRYRIVEATLATPPRLEAGGAIDIAGDIEDLTLPLGEARSLRAAKGSLAIHMMPDTPTSAALHGSLAIDGMALGETRASDVQIRIEGRASSDGVFDGNADLHFASLHSAALDMRDGHVGLRLGGVRVDRTHPLATRGEVALSGEVGALTASPAAASALAVHAHATLSGRAPYAATAEVTAARLQLPSLDGRARVAVDMTSTDFDTVDYELNAHASSNASLLPMQYTALAIESKGRVEHIGGPLPEIRHHTKLDFDDPAASVASARSLAVTVDSRGTTMRHDARIDLRVRALSIAGSERADEHAAISLEIDRAQPSLRVTVAADGVANGKLAAAASFDRARRAVAYDVVADASQLASLAPLVRDVPGVEHVDLSALAVGFSAKGELLGVVRDVASDGTLRLEPRPSATVALRGPMDVRVEHFGFARGDLWLRAAKLGVHADFGFEEGRRTLTSRLDVGAAHIAWGPHEIDVAGISDRFTATVAGDLENPDADVQSHVTLSAVRQEFLAGYPVSDVLVDLSAHRDRRGIVRFDDLRLASAGGGTKISVAGDLDLSHGRHRLALRGRVDQEVARFWTKPGELAGAGRASATIHVDSGDLVFFRTRSAVHLSHVDLRLPRERIDIESLDGEIPIKLDFRAANGAVTLVRGRESSPFELLRFVDQQPLLDRTSFLSAKRVTTAYGTFAPVVGNLQIERNIVSLSQVEMGFRDGRIGGECTLDYAGGDSTFQVHVRANGVRSARGEPFDGTAAFLVSVRDDTVDGRGQILRIGKQEFRDLLDVVDPPHKNASVNRVRSSLAWGYPKRVDLKFNYGFANAHVELGGLASLFSVGDIRGVPTGPVFERLLAQWRRSKGRR